MLLKKIIEKNHYLFLDSVDSWQEAIRMSCKPLEADGTVDKRYAELIIECVNKYGPYIVLFENYAMPHSTENAEGVNGTAIGFMKLEKPVSFDPNDPSKDAKVFFTLAAANKDEHVENMQALFEMLTDEALLEALLQVKSVEDLQALTVMK
ncbi:PTS sugar transporter subunit IIA [Paracholeplasma manati]|jgi:PTS system ascorbate-specific IIA component|uniref:Ascorbate-specific PTS system EIIA component n=1 Tax=Paracholeplasma manati TaxID=591373 RepID=A0ABT2Y9I9_9MOLU|nr:PTS sugar transporter subunit IIA [Paracholeplasma manati]MCV2232695.1 PTS sugar transporter subunit IIA [Paracholeplasma manati]MDG0889558.1 PTS sugar transporter subunit IIA [Paracholeplasma manati]MDX9808108.1 PTS sugar transporter subunit IIA [Acholeplasma sp.]